jgi:tight adherence protein B
VRRRVTWAAGLLAAAAALVLASTATAQKSGATLTEVGSPRFPERAFVLTLPEAARLDPSTVRVLENGKPVSDLSVVPASAAGADEFGVVLVIDASESMRGAAIEGAMEAARSFAAHRNAQQQLAVVTFGGGKTEVLLPFTADAERIAAALGETPELRWGTPLYDGVVKGAELLENARMTAGSLVVLSDGADSGVNGGSVASLEQAAAAAQKAHARVFTVGLRSGVFNASALKKMAREGGGAYAEATSVESLRTVFDKLGSQLALQHLIRYRSLTGPGVNVEVEVMIEGHEGSVTARYETPPLPTKASPPYHRPLNETLWQSPVTMIVASLLAACLVMGAFLVVFNRRKATLRDRMAGFVSMPQDDEKRRRTFLTGKVLQSAEKSLERTRWWARFKEELEIAEIQVSAVSIVVVTGAITLVVMWILYGLGGLLFAPIAIFIPFTVRWFIKRKLGRRRRLFAEQLPDNLQVLSSALRAGHSFVGALSVVVDDSPSPSREEFRRVVADEQLGVPLQDALDEVARRMDNRDLEQVSLVAALQRETGGNTAEVLDRVTETIRERFELRRLVKTLTAQGRMSRWVVSALPVVLLTVITLINPGYMEPLYQTSTGRGLLVASGFFVVMGSIVIGRIVNIKV